MKSLPAWFCAAAAVWSASAADRLRPVVEIEEDVYTYQNANNGAGPMWCSGSTSMVRADGRLFAAGLETLAGVPPLNNCRWVLHERTEAGWKVVHADASGRTREPSPLATIGRGRVLVSANPTLIEPAKEGGGPARPEVWEFQAGNPGRAPLRMAPEWEGNPKFSEHSYRSFVADAAAGEWMLFQNIDYTHAEWTFCDRDGKWAARGRLKWPWGADYEKPGPIRVCYPNVALRNRAVHFLGVSDIQEPNSRWREYKHELTGQHWDYDFRRLFYTWTPDVTRTPFKEWVEIASREKTCGWVSPCDLWLAPDGAVHILWTERALDERLRAKFFPEARQSHGLYYGVIRDGRVVQRKTVAESTEDRPGISGSAARFQPTPDGRLFFAWFASGRGATGAGVSENRVTEVLAGGEFGEPVAIPLAKPFASYFTATVRAGSEPSRWLEMLGPRNGTSQTISYARVRLY